MSQSWRRDKVGIEYGDIFALGDLQSRVQSARFKSVAIGSVDIDDGMAEGGVAVDEGRSDLCCFVGGVVEYLDLQLFARIFHGADRFKEAIDHELLIKDR